MKLKLKAIFFDFDLTLVNSHKGVLATYNTLVKLGHLISSKKTFEQYVGTRVSENIERITLNKTEQKLLYRIFLRVFEHEIPYFDIYGKEILEYAKKKKIKIVILSDNSHEAIEKAMEYWNLPYDYILGDEDMRKGWEKHQEMSEMVKKLHLKKSQVLYVGDHVNDIKEAKKAGVRIASVTTGMFSAKELRKHKPEHIINNLNELRKII